MGLFDRFLNKKRETTELKQSEPQEPPQKEPEKEPKKQENSYNFTDEDREKALLTREVNAARRAKIQLLRDKLAHLRVLQQEQLLEQQVNDLQSQVLGEDEDNEPEIDEQDDELTVLAKGFLQGFMRQSPQQPQQAAIIGGDNIYNSPSPSAATPSPPLLMEISDAEIEAFINTNPDLVKRAKGLPNTLLSKLIQGYIPNISPDSLDRAIKAVKGVKIEQKHK